MEESGKQVEEYTGNISYTYEKNLVLLRELWEETFDDSEGFVDYYFENVCKNNKILSAYIGDTLVGMIHLNPYDMLVDNREVKSYYVVGVAVLFPYRNKGYMKAMMKKTLEDMAKDGVDIAFLMPELEAYYHNLGFKKIYNTKIMNFSIIEPEDFERDISDCYASLMLCTESIKDFASEGLTPVADIINKKIGENYRVFCKRHKDYLEDIIMEHNCQGGDVCVVTEHMMCEDDGETADRNIIGVFSYGIEADTLYVERFEAFENNSMALMISVLNLASELGCARCNITVAEQDIEGYEYILEGVELDVTEGKGVMVNVLCEESEKYFNIMRDNTFIDEIV